MSCRCSRYHSAAHKLFNISALYLHIQYQRFAFMFITNDVFILKAFCMYQLRLCLKGLKELVLIVSEILKKKGNTKNL